MGKSKNGAVPVREFMKFTPKYLLENYFTSNKVLFEDGIIIDMHYKEIVLTRYTLVLLELCETIPIISSYSITNFYTNNMFTSKSINKCFSKMFKDMSAVLYVTNEDYQNRWMAYKTMYQIVNMIYNDIGYGSVEYVTSTDITNYLDIQMDKGLIKTIQDVHVLRDIDSIDTSHDYLDNLLTNDSKYADNPIAKAYVSGMVNPNQIKQILGPRGYVTEIDGSIYAHPIASSFTLGMNSLYDLAIESKSGAKALFLSSKAVQDSEYLARELQLVAMVVKNLWIGDCGSKEYMNWYVRPKTDTTKSDLNNLIGKTYLDEVDGVEKVITAKDKHLENTTIKLRSVMKCKHPDPNTVCSKCFGELSTNVHPHSGLGHLCTASFTQKITQSILSTKHLTSSATTASIKLSETALKFFTIKEKDGYAFRANILGKPRSKHYILLSQEEGFGLKDIKKSSDISKLDPSRITRIESLIVVVETKAGKEYYPVVIKDGTKYGAFTHKFIEYILDTGYTLDENDRYVIDVSKWKYSSPILKLPQVEFSFLTLAKEVKSALKNIKVVRGVKSSEVPESLLQKIFDLVNNKLDINIALLEVLIYSFSIVSMKNRDYRLARNIEDQEVASIKQIMPNRSMGGAYAWEYVVQEITNPASYISKNRIDHPLDVLVCPEQVMAKVNHTK